MNHFIFFETIPDGEFVTCFFIFVGSIAFGVRHLRTIIAYILQLFNPQRREFLVLTKECAIIPSQGIFSFMQKDKIMYWDTIIEINLEDYSVHPWYKKNRIYYKNLYFFESRIPAEPLDTHCLDEIKYEFEFFAHIRQFYQGPIVKEYAKNKFWLLSQNPDGSFKWIHHSVDNSNS